MDALKRHVPATFVPIFLMVNLIAGRPPDGTVELAMKDSVEVVARYPTALMFTTKSGNPEKEVVVVAPPI